MGNQDAHMKEPCNNVVPTADPGRKRQRRKGGTSFNNSKQMRHRELKKKDKMCIEGRGTPTDLSKRCGEVETRSSNRNV